MELTGVWPGEENVEALELKTIKGKVSTLLTSGIQNAQLVVAVSVFFVTYNIIQHGCETYLNESNDCTATRSISTLS